MNGSVPVYAGLALAIAAATGCTPPLRTYQTDVPAVQLRVVGQPGMRDGRVRFREIYCGLLARTRQQPRWTCEGALVRLSDEPPVRAQPAPLLQLDPHLRILFVPGAMAECFRDVGTPYEEAVAHLSAQGLKIDLLHVGGRSSSSYNAEQIAAAVQAEQLGPGEKLVLVGYSKGVPDILEFLVRYPQIGQRVDAVVGIAGAVNGTPLADAFSPLYALIWDLELPSCPSRDGGVFESLRRDERMPWLAAHSLPPGIRYFSLASAAPEEEIARLMFLTKGDLLRVEALNDGQILFYDQLIPGSTLLGYANGDHWAIVLPLQDKWTYWAGNSAGARYPRDTLFEAVVLYLGEALP